MRRYCGYGISAGQRFAVLACLYVEAHLSQTQDILRTTTDEDVEVRKDPDNFWLMIDMIRMHGLIREAYISPLALGQTSTRMGIIRQNQLTDLDAAFVRACRPPENSMGGMRFEEFETEK